MNGAVDDWVRGGAGAFIPQDAQIIYGEAGEYVGFMNLGKFFGPETPIPRPGTSGVGTPPIVPSGDAEKPKGWDWDVFGKSFTGMFSDPVGTVAGNVGGAALASPLFKLIAIAALGALFLWVGLNSLTKGGGGGN